MIPIRLISDESVIVETLERIGIINKFEKIIFPSCYLYKDKDEYFLAHFKELIILYNEDAFNNICSVDEDRRNSIAVLLENWDMVDILNDEDYKTIFVNILPFEVKDEFEIVHKFRIDYEKKEKEDE